MLFDQLLDSVNEQEVIVIPAGWGQGRTIFGGLVAALLVKKAQAVLADATKQLRTAQVNFIAPVMDGEALLQAEVLREGRSVTSVQIRLIQYGHVHAVLSASFGAARESIIVCDPTDAAPILNSPDASQPVPLIDGITPEFCQYFETRLSEGDMPFSASAQPDFAGWMRFASHVKVKKIKLPHVFALVDQWPPAVLPMFNRLAAASSLNWTLDMIDLPNNISADAWWKYQVKTDYAAGGYAYTQAKIWDEHDHLVAISRQTVTVFL